MQHAKVIFDDKRFDEVVHAGLPEGQDVEFVVRDAATSEGWPSVAITFTVQLPDGTVARAQTVATARIMMAVGDAVRGRCGFLGLLPPPTPPPSTPSPSVN